MGKKLIFIFFITMTTCKEDSNTKQVGIANFCQSKIISAFFQEDYRELETYSIQEISRVSIGEYNEPLINLAMSQCNTQMISYLLNRNISLSIKDSLGRTPFIVASDEPCLEAMLLITVTQEYIFHDDAGGDHKLFDKEFIDIARKITMGKSDMDVLRPQDHMGFISKYFDWNLLMYSVLYNNEKYTKKLIDAGYDIDKTDYTHNTPLSIAAKLNNRNIFDELIRSGAKIDAKTPEGQIIIYWSVRRNLIIPITNLK